MSNARTFRLKSGIIYSVTERAGFSSKGALLANSEGLLTNGCEVGLRDSHGLSKNGDRAMPTILIIDDSIGARLTIQEAFAETEFEIVEASNGFEGVEIFRSGQPKIDLVLVDYNMPGKDGLETMAEIFNACQDGQIVPSIMISTESSKELKLRGKALGVRGWIIKPFKKEVLLQGVRQFLKIKA